MPGSSRRRKQLKAELLKLGEETMLLEELDGFIAGLLVCPDIISPNEWLPVIWNQDSDRQSPFRDVDHANSVFRLIMDQYNDVVITLMSHPDDYRPLFPAHNDEILWEVWIEGFSEAVNLRPDAWHKLLDADAETSDAMLGILTLVEIVFDTKEIPSELVDKLTSRANDLIPGWIVTLNNWRIANALPTPVIEHPATPVGSFGQKVGRNEPCPCGSGKKYKRCCGLN